MIAMGFAVSALAIVAIAAVVVIGRGGGDSGPAAAVSGIENNQIAATNLVKLVDVAEVTSDGARLEDRELARALGLEPDDVITAVAGRVIERAYDLQEIVFHLGLMRAKTIYVDLQRGNTLAVVRWQIQGDLRAARRGSAISDPFAAAAGPTDPLIASISKLDDTHYEVPRRSRDQMMYDSARLVAGVQIVPAPNHGGFELVVVPSASVLARVGLVTGDVIHAINGFDVPTPDQLADVVDKVKPADYLTIELVRRGRPVFVNIEVK